MKIQVLFLVKKFVESIPLRLDIHTKHWDESKFFGAPARWPNDLREMQRSLGSGLQPIGPRAIGPWLGKAEFTIDWMRKGEKSPQNASI